MTLVRLRRPRSRQQALCGVLSAILLSAFAGLPPAHAQAAKPAPHAAPPLNNRGFSAQPQQRPSAPAAQGAGERAPLVNPNRPGQAQQHLSQWMESHRNLPLAQQQSALEAEPGFRDLKPQEQQRMRNQLSRLNSLPPEQRQLAIARTEWMERLKPAQRQQVRNAMAQVGSLPPERARAVGRAFRMLRDMPEPQRQAYLNSPQAHAEFNEQERGTIGDLLTVAPLIPPASPTQPR